MTKHTLVLIQRDNVATIINNGEVVDRRRLLPRTVIRHLVNKTPPGWLRTLRLRTLRLRILSFSVCLKTVTVSQNCHHFMPIPCQLQINKNYYEDKIMFEKVYKIWSRILQKRETFRNCPNKARTLKGLSNLCSILSYTHTTYRQVYH